MFYVSKRRDLNLLRTRTMNRLGYYIMDVYDVSALKAGYKPSSHKEEKKQMITKLQQAFLSVFKSGLGGGTTTQASLVFQLNATPVFYAVRQKLD